MLLRMAVGYRCPVGSPRRTYVYQEKSGRPRRGEMDRETETVPVTFARICRLRCYMFFCLKISACVSGNRTGPAHSGRCRVSSRAPTLLPDLCVCREPFHLDFLVCASVSTSFSWYTLLPCVTTEARAGMKRKVITYPRRRDRLLNK